MRPHLAPELQLTIDEFLAFTESRPQEERWELIEGVAVMNASPVEFHQVIAGNILAFLIAFKIEHACSWLPLMGVGTRVPVSPKSLPQPDVYVKEGPATDQPVTDDALVLFEVLSPSNTRSDQAWRRRVYASVPNCQHYVAVSQKAVHVTRYDRSTGWQAQEYKTLSEALALPALGKKALIPLEEIYRWTPLAT